MSRTSRMTTPLWALFAAALAGCPAPTAPRGDGLDASQLPPEVRGDYEVFAQRCSKCHTLARPLNSGIVEDEFWALYVARMRRMPGSGISPDDETRILRFLKFYAAEQRKPKKDKSELEPGHPLGPTTAVARRVP